MQPQHSYVQIVHVDGQQRAVFTTLVYRGNEGGLMQNTIKELTDFSKGNKDNFGITVQYNSVSPLFCILRKSGFISQN